MGRRWLTGTKRRSKGCRRTVLFRYRSTAPENEAGALTRRRFLADIVGQKLGIPVEKKLLVRPKKTMPQKNLSASQRLRNLSGAFAAGTIPQRDPDGPDRGRYLYDGKHDRGLLQGIKGRGDRAGLLCGPLRDRRKIDSPAAERPGIRPAAGADRGLRNPENMAVSAGKHGLAQEIA